MIIECIDFNDVGHWFRFVFVAFWKNKITVYFLVSVQTNHLSLLGKSFAIAMVLSTPYSRINTAKYRFCCDLLQNVHTKKAGVLTAFVEFTL